MLNNISLIGRLCSDPELKTTNSGKSVTSFNIAVDRDIKQEDGTYPADFITLVAWGKTAEFINQYFGKGQLIAVTGRIQSRSYEDKNGNKRTAVEVLVNHTYFCGSKEKGESPRQMPNHIPNDSNALPFNLKPAETSFDEISADADDLPF